MPPRSDVEVQRHRNHVRPGAQAAGNRGGAILQERADDLACRRQLERRKQTGKDRIDVRPCHREFGRAQVVQRMAECVHAVAVDVRDRAGAAHLQIPVHEHHADGVTRLQRSIERHLAGTRAAEAGAARDKTLRAEGAAEQVRHLRLEAGHHERSGDGTKQRAQLTAREAGHRAGALQLCVLRVVDKRPVPVERFAKRDGEVLACQRQVQLNARRWRTHLAERRGVGHLGNRCNAGNRLLRERAERVRDCTNQPAVDVHRTAAHASDDAGVGERSAFEPRQNQVAVRADHILEHAENMGFELFDSSAVEYGSADGHHPGPDVLGAHRARRSLQRGLRRSDDQCRQAGKRHNRDECKSVKAHGFQSIIREKCLLVKEKWAYTLTPSVASGIVLHSVVGRFFMSFSFTPSRPFPMTPQLSAGASYWRWYRGTTEEAHALA